MCARKIESLYPAHGLTFREKVRGLMPKLQQIFSYTDDSGRDHQGLSVNPQTGELYLLSLSVSLIAQRWEYRCHMSENDLVSI